MNRSMRISNPASQINTYSLFDATEVIREVTFSLSPIMVSSFKSSSAEGSLHAITFELDPGDPRT